MRSVVSSLNEILLRKKLYEENHVPVLREILSWRRPHNSAEEKEFVEKHIVSPWVDKYEVRRVGHMENICIIVPGAPDTMFSCHTDTVHRTGGRQEVLYDIGTELFYKDDNEALGGDDGTGVWLLLEMIEAGKPGIYMFHRGEEVGCVGSHWMATNVAPALRTFKRAIAFDRKGFTNVITHQRSSRACSEEFALALAKRLGDGWAPDETGIFTDTGCYPGLIAECTNLSVGYQDAHSGKETQCIEHAMKLRNLCLTISWYDLPTIRIPGPPKFEYKGSAYNSDIYDQQGSTSSGNVSRMTPSTVRGDYRWPASTTMTHAAHSDSAFNREEEEDKKDGAPYDYFKERRDEILDRLPVSATRYTVDRAHFEYDVGLSDIPGMDAKDLLDAALYYPDLVLGWLFDAILESDTAWENERKAEDKRDQLEIRYQQINDLLASKEAQVAGLIRAIKQIKGNAKAVKGAPAKKALAMAMSSNPQEVH